MKLGAKLTSREIEVLEMLAEGLARKQIARRLGLSRWTVKAHCENIMGKLGAGTSAQAVALGYKLGYLRVRPLSVTWSAPESVLVVTPL